MSFKDSVRHGLTLEKQTDINVRKLMSEPNFGIPWPATFERFSLRAPYSPPH